MMAFSFNHSNKSSQKQEDFLQFQKRWQSSSGKSPQKVQLELFLRPIFVKKQFVGNILCKNL